MGKGVVRALDGQLKENNRGDASPPNKRPARTWSAASMSGSFKGSRGFAMLKINTYTSTTSAAADPEPLPYQACTRRGGRVTESAKVGASQQQTSNLSRGRCSITP